MSKIKDKTKEVIISMLTENTGKAMLDSGNYYGRNWERNQSVDFDSLPEVTLDFYAKEESDGKKYTDDISVTIDLYHWLMKRVVFSEDMDKKFHKWVTLSDSNHLGWLQLMEKFTDQLFKKYPAQTGVMYDRRIKPEAVNSYNHECFLSQTIQFVQFTFEGTDYVLLQIHGGCDIRGGYTKPRVFEIDDYFFDWTTATVECEDGHVWDFDGRSWESVEQYDHSQLTLDGSPNIIRNNPLEEYKLEVVGDQVLCPISGKPLQVYTR